MQYQLSVFATVAALFFYFILRRIIKRVAEKHAQRKKLAEHRVYYVLKLYNISSFVLLLLAIAVIWKPIAPYPFILLNLVLSCLAEKQAPIIMMSQNRQEARAIAI